MINWKFHKKKVEIPSAQDEESFTLVLQEASREQVQNLPSALDELRRRVLKAEATLEQKEEENTALREQLKQNETKWIEYEAKMKSMEETWQKQMASLQVSLHSLNIYNEYMLDFHASLAYCGIEMMI